jgi:hypothetical protein
MSKPAVYEHSYRHFEDVQLSAREFYATLRKLIAEHQFPNVECGVVTFADGGLFSSRREYLEVRYQSYRYYICAAPFGRNFFISWWLKEHESLWDRFRNWIEGAKTRSFYEVDTQQIFTSSITFLLDELIKRIQSERGFRAPDAPAQ